MGELRRKEGTGSRWSDAPNLLALTSSLSLNEKKSRKIIAGRERERGREREQERQEGTGPLTYTWFILLFLFIFPGTHQAPRR